MYNLKEFLKGNTKALENICYVRAIGIIPARSGSKGIRHKNIKKLGGIPLVIWTLVQAMNSRLDEIIFDSDSVEYLELASKLAVTTNLDLII